MNLVPLGDLKRHLARWTEKAARGEVVHITKFNRPYVVLAPERDAAVHWGRKLGEPLRAIARAASRGKFLEFLLDDRGVEK
jgi:antitoxin (DNA-binding transcriptional repressor) of toxin-antitoxin stability system